MKIKNKELNKSGLPRIDIEVIDHVGQRYNTIGDYVEGPGGVRISISKLRDMRYEALVAIHELIEYILITDAGISIDDIDEYDKEYERDREYGFNDPNSEPGDDPAAPYHAQHKFATKIERQMAKALGVNWREYSKRINSL